MQSNTEKINRPLQKKELMSLLEIGSYQTLNNLIRTTQVGKPKFGRRFSVSQVKIMYIFLFGE